MELSLRELSWIRDTALVRIGKRDLSQSHKDTEGLGWRETAKMAGHKHRPSSRMSA